MFPRRKSQIFSQPAHWPAPSACDKFYNFDQKAVCSRFQPSLINSQRKALVKTGMSYADKKTMGARTTDIQAQTPLFGSDVASIADRVG